MSLSVRVSCHASVRGASPPFEITGSEMDAIQQRFTAALDALVDDIRKDRSILAALLCGSLSHDVVWEKSDIDLMLITIDDKKVALSGVPLYADGLNVHAMLVPRAEFRKCVEGTLHNSFMHSLLAKGRLLYTHDETIADLCLLLPSRFSAFLGDLLANLAIKEAFDQFAPPCKVSESS